MARYNVLGLAACSAIMVAACTAVTASPACAAVENFDSMATGALPPGWTCGVTGQGTPDWNVEADPAAVSSPNVLRQSGDGDYLWCVDAEASLADGFVETRFRPISGGEDQAGGVVWRFKDGDNYYVARANALEDNVTIYHTINGSRRSFRNVSAHVAPGQWHTLRVDFAGQHFVVTFDGVQVIEVDDNSIEGAGAVGVWTKADSVTDFDDFAYDTQ